MLIARGRSQASRDSRPGAIYPINLLADRGAAVPVTGALGYLQADDRPRSDALENFRASHSDHAAIRADIRRDPFRNNCRRADEASGPDRRYSAIWRPIPRRLEYDPRTTNASCRIIGNCGTWTRRAADENSGEISRGRVDRQNLQERAPLTLPNSGYQALGRRRSSRYEKKKHSGGDAIHILLQGVVVNPDRQDDWQASLNGTDHTARQAPNVHFLRGVSGQASLAYVQLSYAAMPPASEPGTRTE
jgi:hypothetical protein